VVFEGGFRLQPAWAASPPAPDVLLTPSRLRARTVGGARVQIVNQAASKFLGFEPVDVLGYKVMMSDRERPLSTASINACQPTSIFARPRK
jgi:hypothetical protein